MSEATAKVTKVDVAVVGGGPVGLALAKGLLDLDYSVRVIEKDAIFGNGSGAAVTTHDWSKAYSYRLESRGIALMKRIGAFSLVEEQSVPALGFSRNDWLPDGSVQSIPKRTGGSMGYWLQRPKIIQMLSEILPSIVIIRGEVSHIYFNEASQLAEIDLNSGMTIEGMTIKARYVFGCDGIKSKVRETLQELDQSFRVRQLWSPSAGLVFKSTLVKPPVEFDPSRMHGVVGVGDKSSTVRISMLPSHGRPGEMRPISCAREPSCALFQLKTAEDFYTFFETKFPQMNARESIPLASAQAWCETEGSTFPRPRWAGKAITSMHGKIIVGILGDALHSFPPDLGMGVNSGLADVSLVLDFMQEVSGVTPSQTRLKALNQTLVGEARAICQLIPLGFPYQYTLPHSLHKMLFYMDFLTRLGLYKLLKGISYMTRGMVGNLLYPPVVFEIQQDDPPLSFRTMTRHHGYNTAVIYSSVAALVGGVLATFIGRKSLSWERIFNFLLT